MDKAKEIIKENIIWIIILAVLLIGLIGYFLYNTFKGEEIYNDPMLNEESIPLVDYTYEDNEYRVITVENYDVFNSYYKDFITKAMNDPESSWDLVSDTEKSTRFNNEYEQYEEFLKTIINVRSATNKVEKYKVSGSTITVIDSASYMYEFKENGVWNYKVSFKGQVN